MLNKQSTGLLAFWRDYDRKTYVKAAVLADRLGYDSFWLPEVWGYEVFTLLTEIALKTKRIKIGTGIINVFSRSPALIAMQAATLDEISGGRFILGIGTSGKNVIEGLHGRDFEKPLSQTQDVIRVVRTMLDRRPLSEAGTKLREYRPFTLDFEPTRPRIPIYVAALKQKRSPASARLRMAGCPSFGLTTASKMVANGSLRVPPRPVATRTRSRPHPSSRSSRSPAKVRRPKLERSSRSTSAAWASTTSSCSAVLVTKTSATRSNASTGTRRRARWRPTP
ncbi:MAG: LLM class flavin-dependent oxidoreductase [Myxococcales bacterium]|nr:MAG: LLM class flavin-dependent oxidoreductase [Myxococcales bacterium]